VRNSLPWLFGDGCTLKSAISCPQTPSGSSVEPGISMRSKLDTDALLSLRLEVAHPIVRPQCQNRNSVNGGDFQPEDLPGTSSSVLAAPRSRSTRANPRPVAAAVKDAQRRRARPDGREPTAVDAGKIAPCPRRRSEPQCGGSTKNLLRIYQIWIANSAAVGSNNQLIKISRSARMLTDAPQTVAAGDGSGDDLWNDHIGWRTGRNDG
jgi:hypothetical protein